MDKSKEAISQVPVNPNDQSGVALPPLPAFFDTAHKIEIDPHFQPEIYEEDQGEPSKRQKLDDTPSLNAPNHVYEDTLATSPRQVGLYGLDATQVQGGFQPVSNMLGQSTPTSIDPTTGFSLISDVPMTLEALAAFSHMPTETLLQTLTAEQLNQINWHMSGYGMDPQSATVAGQYTNDGDDNNNNSGSVWWNENEEKELVKLVGEEEYKNETLEVAEVDYAAIAKHLGKDESAVRRKYWDLTKSRGNSGGGGRNDDMPADLAYYDNPAGGGPVTGEGSLEVVVGMAAGGSNANGGTDAVYSPPQQQQQGQLVVVVKDESLTSTGKKPRAERKNWTDDETTRMLSFVTDANYRLDQGIQNVAGEMQWGMLSQIFECSVQTAKRKYRHLMEQESAIAEGRIPREKGKRQHHQKKVPYRWMIVSALTQLAGYRGTAPAIFNRIENNPQFQTDLDDRIMPGTKQVPRWKIQVRKVLSADQIFVNTGAKDKHETIWELDSDAVRSAQADRQRDRAGIPPITFPPNYEADSYVQPDPDFANMTPEQQDQQYLAAAVAYATALGIPLEQAQEMTANLTGAQALEMMNQLYQQAYMQNQMAMGEDINGQGGADHNNAEHDNGVQWEQDEPATRAPEENGNIIIAPKEEEEIIKEVEQEEVEGV
jgi:hypothetical protein